MDTSWRKGINRALFPHFILNVRTKKKQTVHWSFESVGSKLIKKVALYNDFLRILSHFVNQGKKQIGIWKKYDAVYIRRKLASTYKCSLYNVEKNNPKIVVLEVDIEVNARINTVIVIFWIYSRVIIFSLIYSLVFVSYLEKYDLEIGSKYYQDDCAYYFNYLNIKPQDDNFRLIFFYFIHLNCWNLHRTWIALVSSNITRFLKILQFLVYACVIAVYIMDETRTFESLYMSLLKIRQGVSFD